MRSRIVTGPVLSLVAIAALAAALIMPVRPAHALGTLPTGFTDEAISSGLSQPVGFCFLPDGRALLTEQRTAKIKLVTLSPLATATIFTVPDVIATGNEQGLLGIAPDPGWPARPYLYVYFDHNGTNTIYIRRYTASGALSDPTSTAITLSGPLNLLTDIPDLASNHNGGTLLFGLDGKLYASLGDDAINHCNAQDLTILSGKIIRLDCSALPDTGSGPVPKSLITPSDNPFAADTSANARLVYEFGLRNPFRFTIDPRTGLLYVGDVGENSWEEYDEGLSGDNFGWPRREGFHPDPLGLTCGIDGKDPIAEYQHAGGSYAIIGGPRYRLRSGPGAVNDFSADYDGDCFFCEYYGGWIRRIHHTPQGPWVIAAQAPGQPTSTEWATGLGAISQINVGPDGALWYLKQFDVPFSGTGSLRRIKGTPTASVGGAPLAPAALALHASPNPGHAPGNIAIDYALPAGGTISLAIYDIAGKRITTLATGMKAAGSYRADWNGLDSRGQDVAPGVYFARLETASGASLSSKLALVR